MAKPIFILGARGSGATHLRLVLDSHPSIAIGAETAVMRLVKAHRFIPFWRFGKAWWERLHLTEEDLNLALRDFYGGFFERHAHRQGKRRWGEKTPLHVWHMDEIATVFDDAVLVGVVRHPLASVASLATEPDSSVGDATKTWLEMNRALVHDGARLGDRFVLVRQEDLISEPEPVLRELLGWLGEPWAPSLLEHDEPNRRKLDSALSEAQRASVRRRTEAWGRFFGYSFDERSPTEPLAPDESSGLRYLLTGEQLAKRREAFAEALDLRRPKRPVREGIFKPAPRRYATRGDETVRDSLVERVRAVARGARG
jgi:hypothetical protein